jgi:hypothetical protein
MTILHPALRVSQEARYDCALIVAAIEDGEISGQARGKPHQYHTPGIYTIQRLMRRKEQHSAC